PPTTSAGRFGSSLALSIPRTPVRTAASCRSREARWRFTASTAVVTAEGGRIARRKSASRRGGTTTRRWGGKAENEAGRLGPSGVPPVRGDDQQLLLQPAAHPRWVPRRQTATRPRLGLLRAAAASLPIGFPPTMHSRRGLPNRLPPRQSQTRTGWAAAGSFAALATSLQQPRSSAGIALPITGRASGFGKEPIGSRSPIMRW